MKEIETQREVETGRQASRQSINNIESRIDITLIERWVACVLKTKQKINTKIYTKVAK